MKQEVRTAVIGCGSMGLHHVRRMLQSDDGTQIRVVCEPSAAAYRQLVELYEAAGRSAPPNEPDLPRLLERYPLDTAFIITPHALHHDQAVACLEAGLDVLLEKPMVMNGAEAQSLIAARTRTERLLVVAFPGSLSPEIRMGAHLVQSGVVGRLTGVSATVWQGWGPAQHGTWRQVPELSGGGFLFDTGAHMLNSVVDLVGEEFVEVAAYMEDLGRPVEVLSVAIGRLASGALVTLHACGETVPSCRSDVRLFGTKAMLRTGIWGRRLSIQYDEATGWEPVPVPRSMGVWQQFLAVRDGKMENPCPPEVGLRMARLYDAIVASAARNGQSVRP